MILCFGVRLARNVQCVVADFCEMDASDQFWIDPMDESEIDRSAEGDDSLSFIDGIEAHRIVWFRSRRITMLAGRS